MVANLVSTKPLSSVTAIPMSTRPWKQETKVFQEPEGRRFKCEN